MKNKGFTLIELLAVIVILALILIIAVPNITNQIKKAKRDTFVSTAKMVMKQIDYDLISRDEGVNDCASADTGCNDHYNLSEDYKILVEKTDSAHVTITLTGTNTGKFKGVIVDADDFIIDGAVEGTLKISNEYPNSIEFKYSLE